MLAVYTFVFSGVFKSRWGGATADSHVDFAVVLFAGLLVHGLFAECVNRAPSLVVGQPSLVKKVVFPLEILPWVTVMSALFHTFAGFLVLIGVSALGSLRLSPTVLLFPLVLAPLVICTLGFVWFLAATGVYLRDLSQGIGVVTTAMLFLSPVFYASAALPEPYGHAADSEPAVVHRRAVARSAHLGPSAQLDRAFRLPGHQSRDRAGRVLVVSEDAARFRGRAVGRPS